jgi:predicted secreted protein
MSRFARVSILLGSVALAATAVAASPASSPQKGKDPNEKVCETQQVLGSRLAVRRVCATRAEWEERRQRERDIIDRTQVQRCAIDPATGLCG